MPRVKPIVDRSDVAPEDHALFNELAALRGRISGPSTIVLHSPGLARPWNQISEYLHKESIVEAPHAELAVCATARERDCGYVWNAHASQARKAGVSTATIDAVRDHGPVTGMSAPDADVVSYVRQLLRGNRVESDVFERLLKAHGPQWMVELTSWIGRYAALSGILNAFEVTHPSPADVLTTVARPAPASTPVRAPLPTPRVPQITRREQVAEEHQAIFDTVAEGRGSVRGPFSILMHSPALCRRHLDVSNYLRFKSGVRGDLKELAIIATAREKDCRYVWAAHAPAARKAGASEASVVAVRDRGPSSALPEAERDVVEYARQLLRQSRVEQPLFERLRDQHGVRTLVELTCLIGHYGIVSGILNAFEVAPAAEAEQLPLS